MKTNDRQPGSFARAATMIPLFMMLAAGIVLGGMLFLVLGLSAIATRVVQRVLPRRSPTRGRPNPAGEVIEGSYVVLDEKAHTGR